MDCRIGTKVPPRNDGILFAKQTVKDLLTYSPTNLLTSKLTPHPVFRFSANAQNRKQTSPSRGEVKRVAFTKPSRGTSVARGEGKSTETLSFRCLPERCRFMRGVAFTLAEVLITLGVIGVVAAMTLPTLIQNHRSQVLKNQFKKAYSILGQAVALAGNEAGISNLSQYCTGYDSGLNVYYNKQECSALIIKQLKATDKRCDYSGGKVFNYNKSKDNAWLDKAATARPKYLLPDGMCVDVNINSGLFGLSVDINGDKKRPNALGHDIFSFWIDERGLLVPIKSSGYLSDDEMQSGFEGCGTNDFRNNSCASTVSQRGNPYSKNSKQNANGLGCSWYAVNDISPDDETKGYWESLPR